ncbi:helix-turn-helix domain-containing protein [Streptomyces omiyaensis]|uniref:helix-turn-helix domain-containing protein n=1 Tax=Streptomyces omiyaensis TaxID=68247 RepID=UPI001679D7D5|nr:helix-turn-helix domain-containing protein [Streptomyces omiyaensis]GGY75150.1 AraC family transcriptional regulator [Streptomyces omiyaensis]
MYEERPALLDGAVLWTRTAPAPDAPVVPDGCMDLIRADGRLLVAGADTRAHRSTEAVARYEGLRFAPGDAPRLLGVPARELRDRRVDLADLWGAATARRLAERIDEAPDPAAALEAYALRRAARTGPADPLLRAVTARLRAGRPVGETADALGLGARRLHRLALDAYGYGPLTLTRVLRLQRALGLLRAGVPPARAAARAGYTDQAHLTRDTRALAGTTPGAYARTAADQAPGAPEPPGTSANSEIP